MIIIHYFLFCFAVIMQVLSRYTLDKLFGPSVGNVTSDKTILYLDLPSNMVLTLLPSSLFLYNPNVFGLTYLNLSDFKKLHRLTFPYALTCQRLFFFMNMFLGWFFSDGLVWCCIQTRHIKCV